MATQRVPPFYAEVKEALDVISQSIALEGAADGRLLPLPLL